MGTNELLKLAGVEDNFSHALNALDTFDGLDAVAPEEGDEEEENELDGLWL